MWGALIGDIVGSRFEFNNYRGKDFELFAPMCCYTDDSVLTVAIAEVLMKHESISDEEQFKKDLVSAFHKYGMEYLGCGFGGRFFEWIIEKNTQPYNSFGNGSAMRVSAVAWYGNTLEEVERLARLTAEITHNHPEGIKGAVVTAGSIFLARTGKSKDEIEKYIESYGYNIDTRVARYRVTNRFDETCQKTIPVAMACFLEGDDFEDVLRNAISVGGDSDTIAAIACSVAEAFYGVNDWFKEKVRINLDKKLYPIVKEFDKKYLIKREKK
jgi:type I restriction enzyme M protein